VELRRQRSLASEPWIIGRNISAGLESPVASSGDKWHDSVAQCYAWRHDVNQSCFIASNFLRTET